MRRLILAALFVLPCLGSSTAARAQTSPEFTISRLTAQELVTIGDGLAARQREIAGLMAKIQQQVQSQPAPTPIPDQRPAGQ